MAFSETRIGSLGLGVLVAVAGQGIGEEVMPIPSAEELAFMKDILAAKKHRYNPGRKKTKGFKSKNVTGIQVHQYSDVDGSLARRFKEKGYNREKRIKRERRDFKNGCHPPAMERSYIRQTASRIPRSSGL